MYKIVDHEGKHAVMSMFDETLIKSRETGTVVAFSDKAKAQALKDVLLRNCIEIINARSVSYQKHSVDGETYGMQLVKQCNIG